MLKLLERAIDSADERLVVLAPEASVPEIFRNVEIDYRRHRNLVRAMQQMRGSIYLRDGAVTSAQLTYDGLHQTPEDDRSWHLLTVNRDGEVTGCAWYLEHPHTVTPQDLRVRHTPLARGIDWRDRLWRAVEGEIGLGVIVYQEQVMQAAQLLAGYTLGQADLLRRAMGKKIRSEMQAQRKHFVLGATERGIDRSQADAIFDLLERFAEYGFNKSHAAAYALVAYQTAYMKANHPVEFIAASMALEMNNTDKLSEFRAEALRLGIKLEPPCVNRSGVAFDVDGNTIHYALAALKGVGAQAVQSIVEARETNRSPTSRTSRNVSIRAP